MNVRDYELDPEPVGRGGMGAVYKGRHANLNVDRAIKVLLCDPDELEDKKKRFLLEAKTQFNLKHPHIVEVFDCFEDTSKLYIVMEYVKGETLKRIIEHHFGIKPHDTIKEPYKGFSLDRKRCVDILCQCLDALSHAHAHKVVHRDIKPANIMLTLDKHLQPTVKLTDFGIAKITGDDGTNEETLTKTGMLLGTVHYMAPEQMETDKTCDIDQRADLYALGITMFEMLTGDLPFGDRTTSIMKVVYNKFHGQSPNMEKYKGSIPPAFYRILEKAIKKDPAERFQNAAEFKDALLHAMDSAKTLKKTKTTTTRTVTLEHAEHVSPLPTPSQSGKWKKMLFLGLIALLLVTAGILAGKNYTAKKKTPVLLKNVQTTGKTNGDFFPAPLQKNNEPVTEAEFFDLVKQVRETHKRLHLRFATERLNSDSYGPEATQQAWQSLNGKEATLFGLVTKIEKQGNTFELFIHNPRLKIEGFNMKATGPLGQQGKEPTLDHIVFFQGTIASYQRGGNGVAPALVVDNAKILQVMDKQNFKDLRERFPIFPKQ